MIDILKPWIEFAALGIGTVVAPTAAIKALYEMHATREHRARELRWQQAREAKYLVDEMWADKSTKDAMEILAHGIQFYKVKEEEMEISFEDMCKAVEEMEKDSSNKGIYARRCLEFFLDKLTRIEHFLSVNLVTFDDVQVPLEYYVNAMSKRKDLFKGFIIERDYEYVLGLLMQFPAWSDEQETTRGPWWKFRFR